jgi:hypothetical protein
MSSPPSGHRWICSMSLCCCCLGVPRAQLVARLAAGPGGAQLAAAAVQHVTWWRQQWTAHAGGQSSATAYKVCRGRRDTCVACAGAATRLTQPDPTPYCPMQACSCWLMTWQAGEAFATPCCRSCGTSTPQRRCSTSRCRSRNSSSSRQQQSARKTAHKPCGAACCPVAAVYCLACRVWS